MSQPRIEKAIDELYEYVDGCKPTKLSPNKVIVERDRLYDLLDELRRLVPEEVVRYKKIISNQENILEDAQVRAESMLKNAQMQTEQLVNQSEVVQLACDKANEIVEAANNEGRRIVNESVADAEQVRNAALYYTSDLLSDAEKIIRNSMQEAKMRFDVFTDALNRDLTIIDTNKRELFPEAAATKEVDPQVEQEVDEILSEQEPEE